MASKTTKMFDYMAVNGRLGWWPVQVHHHNGLTYARRIRRDGTVNRKVVWVRNPNHLREEIPADGRPPYGENNT